MKFLISFLILLSPVAQAQSCSNLTDEVSQMVQRKLSVNSIIGLWSVAEHGLEVTVHNEATLKVTIEQWKDGDHDLHKNLSAKACETERGIRVTVNRFFIQASFEIFLENGVLRFQELSGKRRAGVVRKG